MKFLVILALLMLVACNKEESSDVTSGSISNGLVGTWESCEDDSTTPATSYLYRLNFTETQMTFTFLSFDGLGCNPANLEATETTLSTYTFDNSTIAETVFSASYELHKSSGATTIDVAIANTSPYLCGFSDWAVNTPKNILGVACNGVTIANGDTSSNPVSISGNQMTIGTVIYTKL